ncbi:sec-independent protein translocase protein TATC, chloroplastic [Physcomitrium patens]|uniref:Sec-independent protein translocase protein TATC, chloroplastic n=1 Tax=Physcomitrium patens TaxID=3218 RepID=A0A2K1K625_PHYPA|nr:sec-independent protein translocase protein TATC, chloroplastic-like [Physcomitrium patens]PNR49229.1 hypothetical protein PHYPA_011125 [Physcomitrium patens]|eukprot:XP_024382849.1 sec-independent protein translocase protein TATC, chloroplastic-like [Physcomitrella patens]
MVTMAALAALATTSLGSKLSLGSAMNGNTKRAQSNAAVPVVSSMVAGLLRVHAAKGIQGGLNFARSDNNRVQIFARPEYLKRIETRTAVQSEERQAEELAEDKEEAVFEENSLSKWLYPPEEELPDDKEMTIFDHLEELRERLLVSVLAVGAAILGCFVFAKDLIVLLEKPVSPLGVRFLALSPGEYFFTTLKVSGYTGLLLGSPVILYEIIAFVVPGLTRSERKLLGPVVFGSSFLFYAGLAFSYSVLTPAALNFFVNYAEGVVESLWSIDQYFEFVLVLMFSTGLSFQVPVIQLLLGQTGLITGDQMLSVWRYVVVGAVVAAAILTPSTDPLTQCLLAGPLIGLYMSGALAVKFLINSNETPKLED